MYYLKFVIITNGVPVLTTGQYQQAHLAIVKDIHTNIIFGIDGAAVKISCYSVQ